MAIPRNFELSKIPGQLTGVAFSQRKPKGAGGGTATKTDKLKFRLDVYDPERMAAVQRFHPGSDMLAKQISADDAPGQKLSAVRKLGDVNIKVHDIGGSLLLEGIGAKGDAPKMTIGDQAKTTTWDLTVEVALPPEKARLLKDYYRADVFVSLANAQVEIEDAKKPPKTTRRGGKKPPAEVIDDVDVDEEA